MAETAILTINGERLAALPDGALYWPARGALIVADLHFEKGSSYGRRGVHLPPYDTRATLRRLARLCARLKPQRVISLGDAFHDRGAEIRMGREDAGALAALIEAHDWLWVLGNHDPVPPTRFRGAVEHSLRMGGLFLTHEPQAAPSEPGELAGHLHPCAKVLTGAGRRASSGTVRRRCFAADGRRCVLPSFGAYTGGLNVLDDAFAPLFGDDLVAWALGAQGVYPITPHGLAPDRRSPRMRAG